MVPQGEDGGDGKAGEGSQRLLVGSQAELDQLVAQLSVFFDLQVPSCPCPADPPPTHTPSPPRPPTHPEHGPPLGTPQAPPLPCPPLYTLQVPRSISSCRIFSIAQSF